MFKLHFILGWRNIAKRKLYSIIEILGLATGLTCFLLIALHVKHELSFDNFFKDSDKLYRIIHIEDGSGNRYSGLPSALGVHIRQELPQVKKVVRIFSPYKNYSTTALVAYQDIRFYEAEILEADSNFFEVFNFPFIEGNPDKALKETGLVVISKKASSRYFGNESALGKLITIDGGPALQVSGVVDVPTNTHLQFDFVRPAHHDPSNSYTWIQTLSFTYLKVENPENIPWIEKQLYDIVAKHSTIADAEYLRSYHHLLQPLRQVHTTVLQWDIITATSAQQLYALLGIAIFVLLLAVINFINLSTARAAERMKETGINKIMGASQRRLTFQFLMEFLIVSFIAGISSIILLSITLPVFNDLLGASIQLKSLFQLNVLILISVVLVLTSLLAGVYPAYKLASFKATEVTRRSLTTAGRKDGLRQALVVFQFVISIGLLSGTLIIQKQVRFMQETDLGFDKEQIMILRFRQPNRARFEQLKEKLSATPSISNIAGASTMMGGEPGSDTFHPDHMKEQTPETFAKNIAVDPNFLKLMNIPILQGRNFVIDNDQDYRCAYIVNETAVKQFQLKDPIGENFRRSGDLDGKVIGIMKDFHFSKMSEKTNPLVLYMDSVSSYRYMYVKINANILEGTRMTENAWASVMPEFPIEYFFQDQYFNSLYKQEKQIERIAFWFSMLAIFLSSLGLLGMSSFTITQRTKEIGIRKVVGASVGNIIFLLFKNFVQVILIALAVSIPITLFLMNVWLQDFANRITISAWIFAFSGAAMLLVSLATVGIQTFKAAHANPIESLKME